MANRIVKIEDICHVVKGETGIMKAIPGEFPIVVLSEERKTHNEYQFDCKAVIIPLVSSTGHGHASMKRIHYQEGKFALGSILCALVPKNEGEYDPEYLYHILDMGKERIFVTLMKGMANVSLPMNRIKSVEINLPPYDEQVRLSKIYSEVTINLDSLRNQTDKQHKYIKQLRQSILQLAVKGKLTAKWREENPNVEPANILFEKIISDKEQLIKEGKIKRAKKLLKINTKLLDELPKTWEWVKLGDICWKITDGFHNTPPKSINGFCYIQATHVKPDKIDWQNCYYVEEKFHRELHNKSLPQRGEILIVNIGAGCGTSAIIDVDFEFSFKNVAILKFNQDFILNYYLKFFFDLNREKTYVVLTKGGAQPFLSLKILNEIELPFPPIAEQKEIVNIINQHMVFCNELEKKIEKRDSYQERIMQAVVKQAFTTIKD